MTAEVAAPAAVQGPAAPGVRRPDLGHRDHSRRHGRPRRHPGAAGGRRRSRTGRLHCARHLGVDDPEPDIYARELELTGMEPEAGW